MQIDLRKNMALKYSKIIVGGCSYTEKNYPKSINMDYKMWPEIIGEMSDCEVINTGCSSASNTRIYFEVLDQINLNLNNIKHVYVMWTMFDRQGDCLVNYKTKSYSTKWLRQSIFGTDNYTAADIRKGKLFKLPDIESRKIKPPKIDDVINYNLNLIFGLQCICNEHNIPYTFAQGTQMFTPAENLGGDFNLSNYKKVIQHPLTEKIKNFIGYPTINMTDKYHNELIHFHPNESANKKIAKLLYEY